MSITMKMTGFYLFDFDKDIVCYQKMTGQMTITMGLPGSQMQSVRMTGPMTHEVRQKRMKKRAAAGRRSLAKRARELGAMAAKVVSPREVETAAWVRWKCQYGCGGYGSSLMCPPHTPTPERTREVLDCYGTAVFFEAPRGESKRIACELERELFLDGYYKAFGLGAGPCRLCAECDFEDCRHPYEARPAMEACGIDVFATARKHGFTIEVARDESDPQHYFGLVLVE